MEDDDEDEDGLEKLPVLPEVSVPEEKTDKEKAIELALRYNFVTPVTSLVVTMPPAEGDNSTAPREVVRDPEPISLASQGFASRGISRSRNNVFQARAPVSNYHRYNTRTRIASSSSSGGSGSGSSGYSSTSQVYASPGSARRPAPAPAPPGPNGGSVKKYNVRPQAAPAGPPTYAYDAYSSAVPAMAYDDDYDYDAESAPYNPATTTTTTRKPKTSCSGTLSLYAKTYNRGNATVISADVDDLSVLDFDDQMKSLKVEGDCCWDVFVDAGFGGASQRFSEGEYLSATRFVQLVKKASSVRRVVDCLA